MQIHQQRNAPTRNIPDYLHALYSNNEPKRPFIEDPDGDNQYPCPHPRIASRRSDMIGCGGTMCKLAKRGAHVKVLYMTNSSEEDNSGASREAAPLVQMEEKDSLATLRCFESEHLDPSNQVVCNDINGKQLVRKAIEDYSPDIIFVPWLRDTDPENVIIGLLAAQTLREYESSITVYSYEVWGGLGPNTMVESRTRWKTRSLLSASTIHRGTQ